MHDWEDENAVRLLATCRRAMGEHTSLLLVERLLGGPNEGRLAAFSDLNMMVVPGGQERSESQFAALLAAAGLELTGVVPTAGAFSIIEARLGPGPTS